MLTLLHRLSLLLGTNLYAQLWLRVRVYLWCLLWSRRVLLHKCHVALPDLNKLFLNKFFLSLVFRKSLLHASEYLSVGLQVTNRLVSL